MPCNASTDAPLLQRGCRVLLLVVALGATSIALGLGLPFLLVDAPPAADALLARKAQAAFAPVEPAATPAPAAPAARIGSQG